MAGSGKSKISQEPQTILINNEVFILFQTACPIHKACKNVNGITLHRLFSANPIDCSYEYNTILSLTSFKHDVSHIHIYR